MTQNFPPARAFVLGDHYGDRELADAAVEVRMRLGSALELALDGSTWRTYVEFASSWLRCKRGGHFVVPSSTIETPAGPLAVTPAVLERIAEPIVAWLFDGSEAARISEVSSEIRSKLLALVRAATSARG